MASPCLSLSSVIGLLEMLELELMDDERDGLARSAEALVKVREKVG